MNPLENHCIDLFITPVIKEAQSVAGLAALERIELETVRDNVSTFLCMSVPQALFCESTVGPGSYLSC